MRAALASASAMGSGGRAAALVLGLAVAAMAAAHPDKAQPKNLDALGWPVAAFTLTDQHGQPFTQARLQGHWTFVLLGDTRCARPCEAALAAAAGLLKRIQPAQAHKTTQVLFVSLDPQRDTPQALRSYLAPHQPGFTAVTGAAATLQHLAEDLGAQGDGARPAAPDAPAAYRGSLVLVGPDATVRGEYLPPFDVPLLTADYLKTRVGR
jgi:protein SCO1/2